jgi:hypothetical protein
LGEGQSAGRLCRPPKHACATIIFGDGAGIFRAFHCGAEGGLVVYSGALGDVYQLDD